MRLIGISFNATTRPPLTKGFVPIGDLTVVLGANDAGKTTLLRLIHDELLSTPAVPRPERLKRCCSASSLTVRPIS
jgi:hypothetical protein